MKQIGRFEMWAALTLIVLLVVLSIVGAFYGAEKASKFFNSLPLVVYWLTLTGLLLTGLLTFRRLVSQPGLLLIHLGCVFVLLGAMWGSPAGHRLGKKLFGIDKVPFGYMIIYEGTSENHVVSEDDQVLAELPFSIYLEDFRIDYYYDNEPYLQVEMLEGDKWKIPGKAGQELVLNENKRKIRIMRVFGNFKIDIENGQKVATDAPGLGINPAVEIEIRQSDGTISQQYVFERFPGTDYADNGLKFTYVSPSITGISDYFSDLVLLDGQKQIAKKSIEVNHPLYYGGYHFYQHSYDQKKGEYTILTVVSDNGLNLVYAGYLMLSLAVLWHFWLRHIGTYIKRRVNGN